MDKEQAFRLLNKSILSLSKIPEELPKKLFEICRIIKMKPKQHFLRAGQIPENAGFNLNGIFRLYYIDDNGNEWTKGFSTPGKFLISYSAMVQDRPSYFNIESVIETDILQFRYAEWMNMVESEMRWYPFLYKLLQNVYIMKEMREKSFLLDDATQRYNDFKRDYPDVDKEAKLYDIASFIGITPESLSRIRKKSKNNIGQLQ